jgi:hypothetical protein
LASLLRSGSSLAINGRHRGGRKAGGPRGGPVRHGGGPPGRRRCLPPCAARGLHTASAPRAWLDGQGLTAGDFETGLEERLLAAKLKHHQTAAQAVESFSARRTLRMRRNSLHGNREVRQASAPGVADRLEKVADRTSGMYACGKSDGRISPGKPPNKGMRLAKAVEGRRPAKGNTRFRATGRTQSRVCVLFSGPCVRDAAPPASPPCTRGGSRMR